MCYFFRKKLLKYFFLGISVFFVLPASAYELKFNISPEFFIPVEKTSANYYAMPSMGISADAGVSFFNFLSLGPEIGFYYLTEKNVGSSVLLFHGGVNASCFFFPFSRIELRGGLGAGIFRGGRTADSLCTYSFWWKGFTEASFRISPQLSIGLTGGYLNYCDTSLFSDPLAGGIVCGVMLEYKFDTVKTSGSIGISLDQSESVFPLFYGIYNDAQIGMLTVKNNETAEIKNVTVSFRAGDYSQSLKECGRINLLNRHKTAKISLYADFSPEILNFTEDGKISGEVIIEYEILGKKKQSVSNVTISVYNRNSVRWTDSAVLAAFISPNSNDILEFSKYLVGIARNNVRSGLNRNMQFAMYMVSGIDDAGIQRTSDTTTPYLTYHIDPAKLDSIQYPFQTMAYKSGDLDDMGILLSSMLESVGINTALIPTSDDFIVAFSLGIDANKAASLFNGTEKLLDFGDGSIWIPLSMNKLHEGFINSWYTGIEDLTRCSETEDLNYVILSDAWNTYPPAAINNDPVSLRKPSESEVKNSAEKELARYITAEFGDRIAALKDDITKTGGTAADFNQLGLLYVRTGMYDESLKWFAKGVQLGSASAMTNIGNVLLLQNKAKMAVDWFNQALKANPDSKGAQKGLKRAQSELED